MQTGSVVERTFNAGEKVPKAHVDRRRMQYLYEMDGAYTFMDNETYDQVELNEEQLGDAKNFLLENMEVSIMFFQGIVIGIDLPVARPSTITTCTSPLWGRAAICCMGQST